MSIETRIADAVVTELEATSWSEDFTATRQIQPSFDLETLATLTVVVVPRSATAATVARREVGGVGMNDYRIDVAIQKKVAGKTNDVIDPLLNLGEAIAAHFRRQVLPTMQTATCVAASRDPIYEPDHLNEYSVLTTVVALTYRVITTT